MSQAKGEHLLGESAAAQGLIAIDALGRCRQPPYLRCAKLKRHCVVRASRGLTYDSPQLIPANEGGKSLEEIAALFGDEIAIENMDDVDPNAKVIPKSTHIEVERANGRTKV